MVSQLRSIDLQFAGRANVTARLRPVQIKGSSWPNCAPTIRLFREHFRKLV